ncbi:hypothetical protein E0Z10_g8295 [Xylaria hypoxylon]|uniref:Uncharacterized protein n=1 Tax=Xylaria hypoxylon TaxID=37992 RepID=A0A4Z0YBN2_9PEZI|nr:hypothetical protein E0Z10_g8295 [Xylaria hypoxylon]
MGPGTSIQVHFVGSLYFTLTVGTERRLTRELTIGDTCGWEELNQHEDAWHIINGIGSSSADVQKIKHGLLSRSTQSDSDHEKEDMNRAAWLGHKLPKGRLRSLTAHWKILGRHAIHLAAERGDRDLVDELLLADIENGPNSLIHSSGPDNRQTPLHRAAWGGSLETVKLLLARGSIASTADGKGVTALHIAADMGFGDIVEHLCKQESLSVDVPGPNGLTPLHCAALGGQYDGARMLITQNATVNAKDSKIGWTPLHYAAETGQDSVIELLLDSKAKTDETDDKVGWSPLHLAAIGGHIAAVERLISAGADANKEDINGFTPLIFAAINRYTGVVKTLLREHNTTINASTVGWGLEDMQSSEAVVNWLKANGRQFRATISSAKWAQLYLAALDGCTKITRLIFDDDMDLDEKMDENGDFLLHQTARSGRLETVRLLLQIGTNQMLEDSSGDLPLWCAACAGHEDIARALSPGSNTVVTNELLIKAVEMGKLAAVRALLQVGANPDTQTRHNMTSSKELLEETLKETLLFSAVRNGNQEIFRVLCEAGANIEAKNSWQLSPLMLAIEYRKHRKANVRMCLEAGADIEAKDGNGRTPLMLALEHDNKPSRSIIRILLNAGADVEAKDDNGYTPLMLTSSKHNANRDIIRLLLDAGADTEAINEATGYTALHLAAIRGPVEVTQILLEAGANKEARDSSGRTPLLVAVTVRPGLSVRVPPKAGANKEDMLLAFPGYLEMERTVQVLLEAGADKEARDAAGNTPLLAAAGDSTAGRFAARILLDAGADREVRNSAGDTPLLAAAKLQDVDVVKALLKAGADKEAKDPAGNTPVLAAAGRLCMEQVTLEVGMSAEQTLEAAETARGLVVQVLLQAGADGCAVNLAGHTLSVLIEEHGPKKDVVGKRIVGSYTGIYHYEY